MKKEEKQLFVEKVLGVKEEENISDGDFMKVLSNTYGQIRNKLIKERGLTKQVKSKENTTTETKKNKK